MGKKTCSDQYNENMLKSYRGDKTKGFDGSECWTLNEKEGESLNTLEIKIWKTKMPPGDPDIRKKNISTITRNQVPQQLSN